MQKSKKSTERQEELVNAFRAYLQTTITAEQFGQRAQLSALPGAKTANYCLSLAELNDNILARELAAPVNAILEQIQEAIIDFSRPLYHKTIHDPKKEKEYEDILCELDFALVLISRRIHSLIGFRAKRTNCPDLLIDHIGKMLHGFEAVSLIRKYQKDFPEDVCHDGDTIVDGGFPEMFAWDTYERVEALNDFADEFPDYVKPAAKSMHGWPMLAHRHTSNRKRFEELASRLDLGVDYPLDASEGARFRPDSPFVRYLDPLICKLTYVHSQTVNKTYESPEKETEDLRRWLWDGQDDRLGVDEVEIARVLRKLPRLTKQTAIEWSEKVIVPLIMATDARDWQNSEEAALKQILKQKGVKSRATFKSRLLSAVSATLRRLARPT